MVDSMVKKRTKKIVLPRKPTKFFRVEFSLVGVFFGVIFLGWNFPCVEFSRVEFSLGLIPLNFLGWDFPWAQFYKGGFFLSSDYCSVLKL